MQIEKTKLKLNDLVFDKKFFKQKELKAKLIPINQRI